MPSPREVARRLSEEQIAFVQRSGLKAEVLEHGRVRLRMPLAGNQNHIGSMYAGALLTLAASRGGALALTSFDSAQLYPMINEMSLGFRRPATGDIWVEAGLAHDDIQRLQKQVTEECKAEYVAQLQLIDDSGEVVAQSRGLYNYARADA